MTNQELQNVILLEIVAPLAEEEDTLSQKVRFEIHNRFKEGRNWNNVFKPIENNELRNKYIELFKSLDGDE